MFTSQRLFLFSLALIFLLLASLAVLEMLAVLAVFAVRAARGDRVILSLSWPHWSLPIRFVTSLGSRSNLQGERGEAASMC